MLCFCFKGLLLVVKSTGLQADTQHKLSKRRPLKYTESCITKKTSVVSVSTLAPGSFAICPSVHSLTMRPHCHARSAISKERLTAYFEAHIFLAPSSTLSVWTPFQCFGGCSEEVFVGPFPVHFSSFHPCRSAQFRASTEESGQILRRTSHQGDGWHLESRSQGPASKDGAGTVFRVFGRQ
jgi:hypothetical protein